MKKLTILTLILMLCVSSAVLAKPAVDKPVEPFKGFTRAAEVEDNGSIATANTLAIDDPMAAAIDPVGDEDFFAIDLMAGDCVIFETHPGEGDDVTDTKMYVYDAAETQLAYNDDVGYPNYYSIIEFEAPADGTFYVKVIGYNATSYEGTYVLTAVNCPEPPPVFPGGETCDEAVNLNGMEIFSLDLCNYVNDYDPTSDGCTGYKAEGPEAIYYVILPAGGTIDVCVAPASGSIDLSLYLFTDPMDVMGSCVAGDDSGNPECITYESIDGGLYYLAVDTYSSCGAGETIVTINNIVATENSSFSTIKSLY